MENPISVCMLIANFFPSIGGAEIQCLRLSKSLIKKGINVFVLTRSHPGLKKYELIEGIPVYRLLTFGKGYLNSLFFMFSSFFFLIKYRNQFNIIHIHLASSPAILAGLVGKLLRKKTILKFAGAGFTGDISTSSKSLIGKIKLKFLSSKINAFIAPSKEISKELIKNNFPKEKIFSIPNGVDTNLFSPTINSQNNTFTAIYTGRLAEGKGLEVLLKSWQKVVNYNKNVFLILIGSGPQEDYLRQLTKDLKIDNFVSFAGEKINVVDYYRKANVFILPSYAEGLSNSLLEAMSCGLAVIATRVSGTKDLIEDKVNGILVEPGDIDQLAKEIIFLIEQSNFRQILGERARKTIEENYSIERISLQYISLYQNILSKAT